MHHETEGPGASQACTVWQNPTQDRVIASTYRLLTPIGDGSMGAVYEAEHVRLGTRVAIKLLRPDLMDRDRSLKRFSREVRALAALQDDHVLSVLDCGELQDGMRYLVTERLMGRDLREELRCARPLPVRRAVRIALDVSRGLAALHAAGLVHRDLKPANVFLARRVDGSECCKIIDFGVAKSETNDLTFQGSLLGTLPYVAPEQLIDGGTVDVRTDIYGLGALLYECVVGMPPHAGHTVAELMFDILNRDAALASDVRPTVPRSLARIVACAIARSASERFSSAEAFHCALSDTHLADDETTGIETATVDDPVQTNRPVAASILPTRRADWRSSTGLFVAGLIVGGMVTIGATRFDVARSIHVALAGFESNGHTKDASIRFASQITIPAEIRALDAGPTVAGSLPSERSMPNSAPSSHSARLRHGSAAGGIASRPRSNSSDESFDQASPYVQ